jgi:antitoxin component of MazEF toxin-antitoxin module
MDSKIFNKVVKRWGKSLVVVFNKEDLQVLNNLKEGEVMVIQVNDISRRVIEDV